jgi:release factor glutamine methyltransferase
VTPSLGAVVDEAAARLRQAGLAPADARADAALLARTLLGWDTAAWLTRQIEVASDSFLHRFAPLITRRAAHEPVAYLTGEREFYGRAFKVNRDVLIPRPETELVVEAALGRLAVGPAAARVLDVGTGSGCLAVTLAAERPDARLTATDVSAAALAVAQANAARHRVDARIQWVEGSLLGSLAGPWDLIVSNPPYIRWADRDTLPPDVRDFEPAVALYGGDDGLTVIRALIVAAAGALELAGGLVLEIGAGQAEAVDRCFEEARAFGPRRLLTDLQGIARVVVADRRL